MNENNLLKEKFEISQKIIDFKNDIDVQKLQNLYLTKSYLEILSVNRREISHSSFLAWLLDRNENHLLQNFPINKFLEIILIRGASQIESYNSSFYNSIITDNYTIKTLNIKKEHKINSFGRIDILIELSLIINNNEHNLKIIIENKVSSTENNDQTNSYFNYFEGIKQARDIHLYIYLTAIPSLKLNQLTEPECNCKKFIQINYQDLVDRIIEPILNQNISENTRFILKDYLISLSQPSIMDTEENENKQKTKLIMAFGKEEKELLTNFWKKNEKLIMTAMYAISIDDSQDEDIRETSKKAYDLYATSDRDYSTISLYFDDVAVYKDFRKSDIGFYTIKLLDEKNLIDPKVFEFLRKDKSCNFQLIRTKKEVITETELKKYRVNGNPELIYEGEKYFVARNWGKVNGLDNTEKLIKKITEKFPNISYKRN
ncbi:hypothetical protein AX766_01150 [Flavobacterium covae]|uniref:PD-(D/E)XK nuclease family protein n=1 Tax=Flavobacterium TaxID=237 RepID=UPI0007C1F215|nr:MULTISPECIES: PD-(D/E)XK nuclease family protein [Flavobacterium]AND63126.1 hypothetical protein AX766_01150 [Flavobacterium covae]MCH4828704.1 PD-(D/E)XK nuclease family protein [Flavobacterium columnare]MCH4831958.1 PD-(D/E)XK nuclease family protein [Flavobacterium columnare]